MISIGKPSEATVRRFISEQSKLPFSYQEIGASADKPPDGYNVDHTRSKIGEGKACFEAAQHALRRWQHFHFRWLQAEPGDTPIQEGEVVAVMAHLMGVWWLHACRIISVIDESGPVHRFGFTYGTLPDHAEKGEERFLVEWHESDSCVFYDILAFSRPHHFLARVGYPVVRRIQKKFGRESSAAMMRAVKSPTRP